MKSSTVVDTCYVANVEYRTAKLKQSPLQCIRPFAEVAKWEPDQNMVFASVVIFDVQAKPTLRNRSEKVEGVHRMLLRLM